MVCNLLAIVELVFFIKFHQIYTFIPLISFHIYFYNWKLEHIYVLLRKSFRQACNELYQITWRGYIKPSRRREVGPVETCCPCQLCISCLINWISFNKPSISNISVRTNKKLIPRFAIKNLFWGRKIMITKRVWFVVC